MRMPAGVVVAFGIGLSALSTELPHPGPFSTSTFEFRLADSARNRWVEIILVAPRGEGAFPFVLFSPGFLLSGSAYRSTGELLASYGIAVALLTYNVSLFTVDHRVLAQDLRFVLDQLPGAAEAHGVALNRERVGLVGHSLGGKLSFLAAAEEPSVRAVAGLDPVDGGVPGTDDPVRFPRATDRMQEIPVPKLLIGAERGGEMQFGMPCAPREANYERLFEQAADTAWEVTQIGAGHMDYLDNPNCGFACAVCVAGSDPGHARGEAQTYLVLFFHAYLWDGLQALEDLSARLESDVAAGSVRVRQK